MFERSADAVAELRGGPAPVAVLALGRGLPPARHGSRPRRCHKLRRTSGEVIFCRNVDLIIRDLCGSYRDMIDCT